MVQMPECAYEQDASGRWVRSDDCSTPLAMAVDYLAKRLELLDRGTAAIMLFSGRKAADYPFADHPLHDIDQNPGIEADDGPIRSTYLLKLEGDNAHTDADKQEILKFLQGGDFTYRALPDDPVQEGSGVHVGAVPGLGDRWPGLAAALETMYVDQFLRPADDPLRTHYADGPLWRGACTSIFDSIAAAIELAQERGPYERVSLTVLTDWQNESCAVDVHTSISSVRPLAEALCQGVSAASPSLVGPGVAFTYLFWQEPPERGKFALNVSCSETVIVDVTKPFYSIHMDRTCYAFEPPFNAWYDRTMSLESCSIRYVDRVDPATGKTATDESAEIRINRLLAMPRVLDQTITLSEAAGELPSPIRAGSPWPLELAMDRNSVRNYILDSPDLVGTLRGELLFGADYVGSESYSILPIPPGVVRVSYDVPNVIARQSNDGNSLFVDLKPNTAFLDRRNGDQSVYITSHPSLFELLVNGIPQESPVVPLADGNTRVTLRPRGDLAAGAYEDAISIEHRGDAAARINGESVYRINVTLHMVGFSRDEIAFTRNLWDCDPAGDVELTAGLRVTGIDPSQLSVDVAGFGLTGVDVRPDELICDSGDPGSCTVRLTLSPWEGIRREEVLDPSSPRAICFNARDGEAIRLVAFRSGNGCLPILLTYREMAIEVDRTLPLSGVWEQGGDTSCAEIGGGADTTLAEVRIAPSEDLDASTAETRIKLDVVSSEGLERPFEVLVDGVVETPNDAGEFRLGRSVTLKPVALEAAKNVECNRGYIRIRPADPDVFLWIDGKCQDEARWEYDFRLEQACGELGISTSRFGFGNILQTNPILSTEEIAFTETGSEPTTGQIAIRAVAVLERDGVRTPIPENTFTILPIEPPFEGKRGHVQLEVDQEYLDSIDTCTSATISGELVFDYAAPDDADPGARCSCFSANGNCSEQLRIPFEVTLETDRHEISILNPEFRFSNGLLAPIESRDFIDFDDDLDVPSRGRILVQTADLALEGSGTSEVVELPATSVEIAPITTPFAGGTTRLLVTSIDQDVKDRSDNYTEPSLRGELVLIYEPPEDATRKEQCTTLDMRVGFSIPLTGCHVDVSVTEKVESVEGALDETTYEVTAIHTEDLHGAQAVLTLAEPARLSQAKEVMQAGRVVTWTLAPLPDCESLPLGLSEERFCLSIPDPRDVTSFRADVIFCGDVEGTGEACYTLGLERSASVATQWEGSNPRRQGKQDGKPIDIWRTGDSIATLTVSPRANTECYEQGLEHELVDVVHQGPEDSDGNPFITVTLPDQEGSHLSNVDASLESKYQLIVSATAPRGRAYEGMFRLQARFPDKTHLEPNEPLVYSIHVEHVLWEIVRRVSWGLAGLCFAAISFIIAYIVGKVCYELLRQVLPQLPGDGTGPLEKIKRFWNAHPWCSPAAITVMAVLPTMLILALVASQWTA